MRKKKICKALPRSGAQIDTIALQIIRKYQPEILKVPGPFDIERFFECELEEQYRVSTRYELLPSGIHGYTDSNQMEAVVCSSLMDDASQLRFARSTIAHETGHAIIHIPEFRTKKALLRFIHEKNHAHLKLYREEDIPIFKNPEWQAWRFAGALLMPKPAVAAVLKDGSSVHDLVQIFEVNKPFVEARLRALKICKLS